MNEPLSQQAERMIDAWRQVQQLAIACEAAGFDPVVIGTISPTIEADYVLIHVLREAILSVRQAAGRLLANYKTACGLARQLTGHALVCPTGVENDRPRIPGT